MAKISVELFNEIVRLRFDLQHPTMDRDYADLMGRIKDALTKIIKESA